MSRRDCRVGVRPYGAVMDWTEATWWWEFGLDGIVSGLVGGLVTGVAVIATIRHERKERVRADQ